MLRPFCTAQAAVSALFEGATFTFVFMWVPALLGAYDGDLPTGLVFASFMVCITMGGVVYGLFVGDGAAALLKGDTAVERFSLAVLVVSGAAMAVRTRAVQGCRSLEDSVGGEAITTRRGKRVRCTRPS